MSRRICFPCVYSPVLLNPYAGVNGARRSARRLASTVLNINNSRINSRSRLILSVVKMQVSHSVVIQYLDRYCVILSHKSNPNHCHTSSSIHVHYNSRQIDKGINILGKSHPGQKSNTWPELRDWQEVGAMVSVVVEYIKVRREQTSYVQKTRIETLL